MTKEEYFKLINNNPKDILYEMYKEKFDSSKHKQFLSKEQFFHYLTFYKPIQELFEIAFNYYDDKLNIVRVYDKNLKLILIQ